MIYKYDLTLHFAVSLLLVIAGVATGGFAEEFIGNAIGTTLI